MTNVDRTEGLFEIEYRDRIGVVRFIDRIELHEAARIRSGVDAWIREHDPVGLVFSFADVPYIDSSGVGVFVNLQYRIGRRIPMRLCRVSDTVRDVLTFTNLVIERTEFLTRRRDIMMLTRNTVMGILEKRFRPELKDMIRNSELFSSVSDSVKKNERPITFG